MDAHGDHVLQRQNKTKQKKQEKKVDYLCGAIQVSRNSCERATDQREEAAVDSCLCLQAPARDGELLVQSPFRCHDHTRKKKMVCNIEEECWVRRDLAVLVWTLSEWLRSTHLPHIRYITVSIYVVWKWQANILNEMCACWQHILTHPNDVFFWWSFYLWLLFFLANIFFLFSLFIIIIQMLEICYTSVFRFCVFFLLSSRQQKQNRTAFCFRAYVFKKIVL